MNAGSTTLSEIKLTDHLKTQTEWKNLHAAILAEQDQAKAAKLRAEALTADYYFTSVSAITHDGSFIACDLTGTRTVLFSINPREPLSKLLDTLWLLQEQTRSLPILLLLVLDKPSTACQ